MKKNQYDLHLGAGIRFAWVMTGLAVLLLWGLVLNVNIGSVRIPAGQVYRMLWEGLRVSAVNLFTGADSVPPSWADTTGQILFEIRLPRMLLAAVLGGALSVSGFLLQTFFRNPIAGPFVLGISSGAKMVVGIALIFLTPVLGYLQSGEMVAAAFLGSLLITGLVLVFSQKVGNMSMLLVIGIMVSYICSAVTDFCVTFADEQDIVNLSNWSRGTFSGAGWDHVKLSCRICFPGVLAAWLLSKPMGAYALGENYAKSMGVAVKPFRLGLILLSSLLSACVTALAGPISFVGIAVPHITRTLLKTSKPALVIPASFLCGCVFCVFCDLLARTIFAPTELAIGTVTSLFGAPVVIYMMVKRRKAQEG